MVAARQLRNSPIREALIDLRVKLVPGFELGKLEKIHDLVMKRFPNKQPRQSWTAEFGLQEGKPLLPKMTEPKPDGFFFRSHDGVRIFQARLDGFTSNRLRPYGSWDEFKSEAADTWKIYVGAASPEAITRVAVRFINDFELPLPLDNLGDYISIPAPVPPKLVYPVATLTTRTVVVEEKLAVTGVISQTLQPSLSKGKCSFLLDLDLFKEAHFDVDGQEAWKTIEELHRITEEIFFESITEKAVELFS